MTDRAAAELFAVLIAEEEGQPRFSEEEILAFVPTLLLCYGDDPSEEAKVLADDLARRAGVQPGDDAATIDRKLLELQEKHPVPPALVQAFEGVLRRQAASGDPDAEARYRRFAGAAKTELPLNARGGQGHSPLALRLANPGSAQLDKGAKTPTESTESKDGES